MHSARTGIPGPHRADRSQDPTGECVASRLTPCKRTFPESQETPHHYNNPQIIAYQDKRCKKDNSEYHINPTASWFASNNNDNSSPRPAITAHDYLPPSEKLQLHSSGEDKGPVREGLKNCFETQFYPPGVSQPPQTAYSGQNNRFPVFGYAGHNQGTGLRDTGYIEGDSYGDVVMQDVDVDDSEICFGMIQDAKVTSARGNVCQPIALDRDTGKHNRRKAPEITPVIIQSRKPLTTVHLQSGVYIGLLDSKTLKGINQLLLLPSIRLQSFLPIQDPPTKGLAGDTSKVRQVSICVCINIYGPRHIVDSVGKVLSNNEIYLQHPKHNDGQLEYQNPHYFTRPEDTNTSVAKTRLLGNVQEKIKTIFELSVNASLPEVVLNGNELQTPLLSHQKQAVYFMLQKETNNSLKGESIVPTTIWKLGKTENGCTKYINSITKETTCKQPPGMHGGILADEMGLGKSLTLALITSTMDQAKHFGDSPINHPTFNCAKPRLQSKTTLIVAPASLLESWREQINMHIKPGFLEVYIYHGSQKETDPEKLLMFDIIITTYPTIRAEIFPKGVSQSQSSPLNSIKWFRIVLDEAHIIRERSTQQSQAVCLLEAQRRWCLTGTPIQNKLHDFGTLLRFLRVSPFSEEASFNRHIIRPLKMANPDGLVKLRTLIGSTCLRRNKNILELPPRTDQTQYIHFSPFDRQRYEACKRDSARLIENTLAGNKQGSNYFSILQSILRLRLFCNHGTELLPTEVRNRLEYTSTEPLTGLDSSIHSFTEMSYETYTSTCGLCNTSIDPTETEIQSFATCSHTICVSCLTLYEPQSTQYELAIAELTCPICAVPEECSPNTVEQGGPKWMEGMEYSGPSTKVKALIENLQRFKSECIDEPAKSIVFSCWTKMLDLIGLALDSENIGYVRFDGSFSIQQRKNSIDRFREDPEVNVLLISIGSGAVGLNLTIASRVHLMEPQWNPMVEQQALDRLHRIGQKKEVIATRYIVKSSIEESILAFQQRKLALANISLSQNQPAGKGSNQHLKELQALFK